MKTQKGLTIVSQKELAKVGKALAVSAKAIGAAHATVLAIAGEAPAKKTRAKKAPAVETAPVAAKTGPGDEPVKTAQPKAAAQPKAIKAPTKAPVAKAKANGSFNAPRMPGSAHA